MNRSGITSLRAGLAAIALLWAGITAREWTLPYPQPAVYDYAALYSQALNDYLTASPEFFKAEQTKAWSYYKSTFIMTNGLVNHQRLDNNVIVGSGEAVSEGQGYGMLLAVLNNDQLTFNTIFEAANRYMWNDSRKSYFIWNWPGNQQGAATDADLDIGLALVFADELQKKSLWTPYNKNSITYASRAMDIIRSIRQHMTSNDYLLPGDNWGGEGLNNLNPSYFGTAWLKVFNAYQSEVNFTPVIDKCYQVLKAMPNYAKGQAADWVNAQGGQSSQGGSKPYRGLGMTSDGIRTPWRIALDALWFNDARAIEYCSTSMATLTEYANTSSNYLMAQMAQYTDNGTAVAETKGSFDNVSMWTCAILGSRSSAYTQKAIQPAVFGKIIGTSANHLGASSLQDEKFYFKQSIGALGFATITGQFPNILADMRNPLPPPKPVALTTRLQADKSSIELPGTVTFTAALDQSVSWTITVTGRTSKAGAVLIGTGRAISAAWTGVGFYTIETVDAVLSATGLDTATSKDLLRTSVALTKVPPRPSVEPGSTMLLHDLENNSTINAWGGAWYVYNDRTTSGSSTTDPADARYVVRAGEGNPGYCVRVLYTIDQYAGVGVTFAEQGTVDLTPFESITFDYKTQNTTTVLFMLATTNITNHAYSLTALTGSTTWKTQTVRLSDLQPPNWSPGTLKDVRVSEKIQWQVETKGTNGTIWIDNVKLNLKAGALPGQDILSLIQGSAATGGGSITVLSGTMLRISSDASALTIHLPSPTDARHLDIKLHSLSGRTIISRRVPAPAGSQSVRIPRGGVASGCYLLDLAALDRDGRRTGHWVATARF